MIVVGGSFGGTAALHEILARLPADFPQPIAVALHRHRDSDGLLAPDLQQGCRLPVREVEDKEPIAPGHVYLCPPDYHLLVDADCFSLSTDELVNFARPSIDLLFESAAVWAQPIVAVVLSGASSDGARGARSIEDRGGIVLIQYPDTAPGPWMPSAAIAATRAARVLTLEQIATTLTQLATEAAARR